MKIGALAKQVGLSVQTIRFYEQEGLVSVPQRTEGNYRLYDTETLGQFGFIKQCRNLGLTLDEIRELIKYQSTPEEACGEINHIVNVHVQEVDARIAELTALRDQLISLRRCCNSSRAVKDCGILKALTTT